jgi:hypothetical protein
VMITPKYRVGDQLYYEMPGDKIKEVVTIKEVLINHRYTPLEHVEYWITSEKRPEDAGRRVREDALSPRQLQIF